jgi:hypothetical protein
VPGGGCKTIPRPSFLCMTAEPTGKNQVESGAGGEVLEVAEVLLLLLPPLLFFLFFIGNDDDGDDWGPTALVGSSDPLLIICLLPRQEGCCRTLLDMGDFCALLPLFCQGCCGLYDFVWSGRDDDVVVGFLFMA